VETVATPQAIASSADSYVPSPATEGISAISAEA
jgi:hypothetical protein